MNIIDRKGRKIKEIRRKINPKVKGRKEESKKDHKFRENKEKKT
jgi:hypothetical protein